MFRKEKSLRERGESGSVTTNFVALYLLTYFGPSQYKT